jgi:cytochrome c oxidase cbb3-type subunit III
MSDFMSGFWGQAIALVTVAGMVACVVLLIISGRTKPSTSIDGSTGHIWDEDLKEMNNPLPLWWVGLFLITVVFAAGYLVLYPGLGAAPGQLGWSSSGQHAQESLKLTEQVAPLYASFDKLSVPELARDPKALATGQRLFLNQCSQCHGSDGRGSRGFPNLADKDWLHGGSPEKIIETIKHGRQGMMPALGAAVGSSTDIANLANYVLSLSGSPHDPVKAALGQPKFAACAACHGAKGEGNQALGAPNLSDKIWLHGWGEQAIANIVINGRNNVMPAQADKLTEAQVRVLAGYVLSLSQ